MKLTGEKNQGKTWTSATFSIPHGLNRYRTWASAVEGRRITAWQGLRLVLLSSPEYFTGISRLEN
jgi:hypothetical protein